MSYDALMIGGIVAATALAPSSASVISTLIDAPIVIPFDNAQVSVELVSASAQYTGKLHFLGTQSPGGVLVTAPLPDEGAFGQPLFQNHDDPQDSKRNLDGVFQAGQILHFAYDIMFPDFASAEWMRSDLALDASQFAFDPSTGELRIEDIRINHDGSQPEPYRQSDLDYNDMVAKITFTQIPAPGTAVLTLTGMLAMFGKRRRTV